MFSLLTDKSHRTRIEYPNFARIDDIISIDSWYHGEHTISTNAQYNARIFPSFLAGRTLGSRYRSDIRSKEEEGSSSDEEEGSSEDEEGSEEEEGSSSEEEEDSSEEE